MKKRIYISGPITNDPDYMNKFNSAEIDLIDEGYTSIINPAFVAKSLPDDFTHENYMQVALAELRQCEAVFMLKGWKESVGACREYQEAVDRGMEIVYQK